MSATTPALDTLDPDALARTVVGRVVDHLHRVAFTLAPALEVRIDGDPESLTTLGATMRALTHYARAGLPVWDWTDHGMASDGLLEILAALYTIAGDATLQHTAIDEVDDLDPEDDVARVLVAAGARVRLSQGAPLSARELSVLTGLTAARIRQLVSSGELSVTDERPARVTAEDAARWLAARGVAGV